MGEVLEDSHISESAVLDYVEGREHGRVEVDRHLDGCSECRVLVAKLASSPGPGTSPTAASTFETGSLLAGRFRLGRALGKGAMATVFEATDEALGTPVALKIFAADLCADPRMLRAIQREATLGRRLRHRNVRQIYDLVTSDPFLFLSMELIEGETLEQRLSGEDALAERAALRVLDQICEGVAAAHAAGVVHRDLKPSNIILESTDRVVVVDFGLARDLHDDANRSRGLVGTPAYWSPEQARGEHASPASDVYALGLLAYRLLTGRPFSLRGDSCMPRKYAAVIARCLEQRPNDRYPDAAAFRAALTRAHTARHWRSGVGVAAALTVAVTGVVVACTAPERFSAGARARPVPGIVMPTPRAIELSSATHVEEPANPVRATARAKPVQRPAKRSDVLATAASESLTTPDGRAIDRESPYAAAAR